MTLSEVARVVAQHIPQQMPCCLLITPHNLFPIVPAIQNPGASDQFQVGIRSWRNTPALASPHCANPKQKYTETRARERPLRLSFLMFKRRAIYILHCWG